MDASKQALMERLTAAADRMSEKMRQSTMHESMQDWSELDLTMPQLRTLGFLARDACRMGEVAAYLGSSVSSATSLVERLEGKGLVRRIHNPIDRRVVMCHLAPRGREVVDRFWRMQRLKLESVADLLNIAELARVTEAVELLAGAFERRASEPVAASAELNTVAVSD